MATKVYVVRRNGRRKKRAQIVITLRHAAILLAASLLQSCNSHDVIAAAPSVPLNLAFHFCDGDAPVFLAYKSENGPWTTVNIIANTALFRAGPRVTLAAVSSPGYYRRIDFVFATASELAQMSNPICSVVSGTKSVSGSVTGVDPSEVANILIGPTLIYANDSGFTTLRAPNAATDLIGMRSTATSPSHVNKFIVRRGVNPPSGSTISPLDFNAAEAVTAAEDTAAVPGAGTDLVSSYLYFVDPLSTKIQLQFWQGASASFFSLPEVTTLAGDYHWLAATARRSNAVAAVRGVNTYFRVPANQRIEFGPELATPAVSVVTQIPYVRLRGQLAVQNEYPAYGYFFLKYEEPEEFAIIYSLLETRGYAGASVTTWDATVPDLSALPGFQSSWMMQPNQTLIDWSAAAASGGVRAASLADPFWESRPAFLHGAEPQDGETDRYARTMHGPSQFGTVTRWRRRSRGDVGFRSPFRDTE